MFCSQCFLKFTELICIILFVFVSLFDSNEEGDRDETEADIRLQDLTYELVRRPEVDPQATYTLLPSPLIEDHTIVDSSATLVGPAYVGDEFNKTNPGRSRILLNEFDEDEDDENTFRNVDLEPLEDAGISLRGDQDDDPTTFDLLDGSEMSTSISYVDNIQPPSIMQQLDISLQSDSGVSLIGSSRPDSGSTGQVRSRIPRFKSRLPKPKSNATVQSINQNHSSDDFNFRASNIVSTSSSSSTSTLTRKTGSANRSMILDRIDSPPNSPYSDLSGSDACQTPTGDTFTIRRGSMPEYSASCTPLEHVHPPSAMDALSAMSSTYGSINSICSDMCDSLGSCSDMPDSIGGTPPPPSPVTTRSIHAPTINSGTVRRATIARPVQRPPPLNNSSTNTRTQITNGFQTYRKSSATRTSTNSTPGTISSCRDPNQSSTLPRPVSSNMIISAVRSTSSGNMNPSSAMTMTGSSTLVRRRTTSSSAGAHRNQSNASVNENKPPLRTRPTQSKSAGEISSMHQNGINGSCNKSVTTIRKPQSKIASLWKRTVSVQQQQQTSPATKSVVKKPASPAIGKLTSKSTTNRPSTNGSTRTDDSSASTQSSGALVRSGTFEKLPVTDDEAARIGTSTGNKSKVRPFDGSRKTPCRQF